MKYFICAAPGTFSQMVAMIVRNAVNGIINPYFHVAETDEDFYSQVQFPMVPSQDTPVITYCYFRVNFDRMMQEFPGCKIIVITHKLFEINSIVQPLFKDYYVNGWPEISGQVFKSTLEKYPYIFPDSNVSPSNLTKSQRIAFLKILEYQKLLEGYHCVNVPSSPDVVELNHREFTMNVALTKQKISTFLGVEFTEDMNNAYEHFLKHAMFNSTNRMINENLVL